MTKILEHFLTLLGIKNERVYHMALLFMLDGLKHKLIDNKPSNQR